MNTEGFKGPISFEINRIDRRPASEVRANRIDKDAVDRYADPEVFEKLPAVVLIADKDDKHWLAAGDHRVAAAIQQKMKYVQAYIKRGDYIEAFGIAAKDNDEHGVPATTADKQHRVKLALKHPEMSTWTNARVAEHCGVSEATVQRQRTNIPSVKESAGPERTNIPSLKESAGPENPSPSWEPPAIRETRAQKRERILGAIRDPKMKGWSIATLARHCRVSPNLVCELRKSLKSQGSEESQPAESGTHVNGKPPPASVAQEDESDNAPAPSTDSDEDIEDDPPEAWEAHWRRIEGILRRELASLSEGDRYEVATQLSLFARRLIRESPGVIDKSYTSSLPGLGED